mgnify:CR=1 FL=1
MGQIYQKRLKHSNKMDLRIEKAILEDSANLSKIVKQKYYCVSKVEA